MIKKGQAHSLANLTLFREKVTAARRQAGRLQRELASALGLNAQVLSRKLHGTKQTVLTHTEVAQIIRTLASWDAITTQAEASELLTLMGLKANFFSAQDWQAAPLKQLTSMLDSNTPTAASLPPPVLSTDFLLPKPSTPLIGREQDVQILLDRLHLARIRLLTLLGTGGVGKTRLALEVAYAARHDFTDGVFFVPLTTLHDSALVPSTIVQTLHLTEPIEGGQSALSHEAILKAFLRDKKLLLVLDNVEQLPEIAPFIDDLLSSTEALKVMVTSRAVLHLYGEYEFDVPPLAVCTPDHLPTLDSIAQFAAIRLFVERAQAINSAFQITQHNAATISQICTRLDGLPLAIELAAVQTRVLPLPDILEQLSSGTSLVFLHTSAANTFQRHRTLHATLDWSYQLLDPLYQTLFRRLSVFLGSWTMEAALAIVLFENQAATLDDVLEQMEALIDQSLLKQVPQKGASAEEMLEPRFHFLETIREYGLGQLTASGELADIQRRHADYYLTLVEKIEPILFEPAHPAAIATLEREQDNLRAALAWANEHNEAEIALRLSSALGWLWEARTQFHEASRWIDAVFKMKAETPSAVRAKLLMGASRLAQWEIGCVRSRELAQEALTLYKAAGDQTGQAWAIFQIADTWHMQGDYGLASKYLQESLHLLHEQEDWRNYAFTLSRLGALATLQGNIQQARSWLDEAVTLLCEYNEPGLLTVTLIYLGILSLLQGELVQSIVHLREGLLQAQHTGNRYMLATDLAALGCVLGIVHEPSLAAHICSGAEALYDNLNTPMPVAYRPLYETYLGKIKSRVDAITWARWWAEGKALSLDEICALAL